MPRELERRKRKLKSDLHKVEKKIAEYKRKKRSKAKKKPARRPRRLKNGRFAKR